MLPLSLSPPLIRFPTDLSTRPATVSTALWFTRSAIVLLSYTPPHYLVTDSPNALSLVSLLTQSHNQRPTDTALLRRIQCPFDVNKLYGGRAEHVSASVCVWLQITILLTVAAFLSA